MAGMRDVAKLAGVSLSSVSVVLGDSHKFVSKDIADRVRAAARELNYVRPSRTRFTQKTIAVVLSAATSVFFSNVLNGIEETLAAGKNLMLYYNSNFSFEKEKNCIRTLKKQSLAGIILDSVCPPAQEADYLNWLKESFVDAGIPVVFLEREVNRDGFYSIYINNFQSAYDATSYLISQGHDHIAHIEGNTSIALAEERLNGYKAALEDHGIPYRPELVQKGDFSSYSGYIATKRLIDLNPKMTAIFSANDQMAVGAIKAVKLSGKSVPENIAVMGFDNLSICSLISPALTTVNVPTYQMGRQAAWLVLQASENQPCKSKYVLETNLIIRRSSELTASDEWELNNW